MTSKFKLHPHIVIIKNKNGTINLYSPETYKLYYLNKTASLILTLLLKGESKEKIIDKLVKNFNVSYNKALNDYDSFIKLLITKNLLNPC